MNRLLLYFVLCTAFATLPASCASSGRNNNGDRHDDNPMVHAEGRHLVDGNGNSIAPLRGIAFGNNVWQNPDTPPENHHSAQDYCDLAAMGFTSVRFYLNYGLFEDDSSPYTYREEGFRWIEQNVEWARDAGIYLVLNMHVPQGGFQSLGKGDALWEVESNGRRFSALWKEIARRFRDEEVILGYGLLNEPIPSRNISQWETLAKRTVREIRSVDPYHLVIVERAIAVNDDYSGNTNGKHNFFLLNDNNVMYEFHFYEPMPFSHQGAEWISGYKDLRSEYPDPDVIESTGEWTWATFTNPTLAADAEGWVALDGNAYTHSADSGYDYAVPTLQAEGIGRGTVWFDDVTITEKDKSGTTVRTISLSMDDESADGWYFWSADQSGSGGKDSGNGRNGTACLYISGTYGDSNLSLHSLKIALREGYTYRIDGWARGENIESGSGARFRLDFYDTDEPLMKRNRDYLKHRIETITSHLRDKNVPVYLGEYGCTRYAFENGRGGAEWVRDVIEISEGYGIHHNYHTFHETMFGLYQNEAHLPPDNRNETLADLFTQLFAE